MKLRLANISDLPKLKNIFRKIVDNMNKSNIPIWDEIYPCEFLANDIKNSCLYVLEKNNDIVSAFALNSTHSGEPYVKWKNTQAKVLYIDRLGVNVDYLRKGIGDMMINNAINLGKNNGVKYLRLFVVDINKPAINLYTKNGFKQVDGVYKEKIDDNLTFNELGFEIEL